MSSGVAEAEFSTGVSKDVLVAAVRRNPAEIPETLRSLLKDLVSDSKSFQGPGVTEWMYDLLPKESLRTDGLSAAAYQMICQ